MKRKSGKFILKKVRGENYKAYVPCKLPPHPSIDLERLYPFLEKATRALAELDAIHKTIPNTSLFLYMYVRKEALLSSQIEGTQSSFSDLMLFEHNEKPQVSLDDVEEVSNYVKAIHFGLTRLEEGFPLSLRLLKDIHAILLSGGRGSTKLPGDFRTSQNWIGGTRPGNALFVPPPIEELMQCLSDFELFLHDEDLPVLVKAGLAHVQFETIHPFLDGNGRLGRLLITLLLCHEKILQQPVLYFSLYLKQNRLLYYNLLQEVRISGTFETWLEFFLEGITKSAHQGVKTISDINILFDEDEAKIRTLGRQRFSCEKIFEFLKTLPQVSVPLLQKKLNMTAPTARNGLNTLLSLGIVEEVTFQERDKVYVYIKYLNMLEEGADPLNYSHK